LVQCHSHGQKGLENLKKAYGQSGYINFGAIPKPSFDDVKKTVSLDIDIDEGKPFYVSRIEFQGNTITRDKVIRRELMLDEGSVYNSQLWEYSLLRLNQLQYFEPLKVDQDSEAHQDAEAGTVDLLLKVKEKGKNSIGLNGGVSGLSGAFLGVNYQTNNFLGLARRSAFRATWATSPAPSSSALLSPTCESSTQPRLPDLQQQAGLQRRQELPGHHRAIRQSHPRRSNRSRRITTRPPPASTSPSAIRSGATPSSASA
jgi:outer membrane protein assembly factor BamA